VPRPFNIKPMIEKKVPLTKDAYERIKQEIEFLEGPDRRRLAESIGAARAHGDIAENAEYHAAKEEQGRQEAKIRELKAMVDNAEIIEADEDEIVKPGKLVTIRYEGDEPETYLFGVRQEKGGDHDVLTPESPIGSALAGRAAGETVTAAVPAGQLKIEIVEVRPAS
jgi:transcription elongation factor GreA